jgi:hypothetical protein
MRETRPVSDFTAIVTQGYGTIILKQGETCSLEIEADEDVLPHIKSEVVNSRLEISFKNWWRVFFSFFPPIRFYITVKQINSILIAGAGNLESDKIVTDSLDLDLTGSGKVNINTLEATRLELSISGSGEIQVAGTAETCEMKISGSGKFITQNLHLQESRVRISGSGDIALQVDKKLDVRISGSGTVKYLGKPELSQIISGSGRIQPL